MYNCVHLLSSMIAGSSEAGVSVPLMKESYSIFRKEVKLWDSITPLKEERKAGTIVIKLPPKSKAICLDIDPDVLAKGLERNGQRISGIQRLIEVLDGIYLEDLMKEKFKCYKEFKSCKRKMEEPIHDFLLDYDKKIRNLKEHGIALPEDVLAFELLDTANLTENQQALAFTTVPEMTYDSMKDQIKKTVVNKGDKPPEDV